MIKTTSQKGAVFPVDQAQNAVAEFGINPEAVRVITLALDTALVNFTIDVTGSVVWAFDATSLSASISMRLQTQANDKLTVKKGFFLGGVRFSHLIIDAAAQAGESVTLMIVKEQADALRVVNPSADFTAVTVSKSNTFDSTADTVIAAGGTAIISAADSTRRVAYVTNNDAATTIRIGDAGVGAANGTPLGPGQTMTIETTAEIRGYNPGAAGVSVSYSHTAD